ncbi:MAG TPA: serine hydrolase, partial [Labilithrix sp.]|nr:serine hydrolase [Labilithrix sp.]
AAPRALPLTATVPAPIAAMPAPAPGATTPEAAVTRLFTEQPSRQEWFAPSFLEAVTTSKIDALVTSMKDDLGAIKGVTKTEERYLSTFERGTVATTIRLDEAGRFTGLFFGSPQLAKVPLPEALARFAALPGKVSVCVASKGAPNEGLKMDVPLAVGSTFKLSILAALRDRIEVEKKLSWEHVVALEARHKSLPSGILQDWPDKTPLTVASLAALMISRSDNTATDALLDLVGRARVEQRGSRNKPFLSTREMFVLKAKAGEPLLARWRSGDETARRKLLDEAKAAPLPPVDGVSAAPTALDVEWFYTTGELCALMAKVADLPAMHINPGLVDPKRWDAVAYKGGSEPGVINMTTFVRKGDRSHCVSATWNDDKALEEAKFESAYAMLLAALTDR